MKIYVDADAFPAALREILFRAALRRNIAIVMVANRHINCPHANISMVVAPSGPDEADDRIAAMAATGDIVITADIPLADRVITKGAIAINPRGETYTQANIKSILATRDLLEQLRNSGEISGCGSAPLGVKDREKFANAIDRVLTRHSQS